MAQVSLHDGRMQQENNLGSSLPMSTSRNEETCTSKGIGR